MIGPWPLLPLLIVAVTASSRTEVPEDFLIRLETVQNISQFLNRWIDQAAVQRAYLFQGEDGDSVEVAYPAGCVPEMQIVEFERPFDPSLVIWPVCTRVRRCGGCCSSKLLHCVPTRTSTITVKVIKARYPHPGAETLQLEGFERVRLEQHERCACRCREQARDCSHLQRYAAAQCRCVCADAQAAQRCRPPHHFWDSGACVCRCREQRDCSTGSAFNDSTCECESVASPVLERGPPLRDDGGENDAYRLRHSAAEGPFAPLWTLSNATGP